MGSSSRFRNIQLLLLHLLVLQEMIAILGVEGAMICESPSRLFKGACFSSHNCGTICETERFQNGQCKFFKCICSKDCNLGGGGGGHGGTGSGGGGDGGGDGDGSGNGVPSGNDSPPNGGDSPPDGGEAPPAPDDGASQPAPAF